MNYTLWVILVGLTTWFGDSRRIGKWWTLGLSILLSPLIGFIIALISGKKDD